MKNCRKCRKNKDIECFDLNPNNTSGLHTYCNDCIDNIVDKVCKECNFIKPIDDFVVDQIRLDKRSRICKICQQEKNRDFRKNKREYHRAWSAKNRAASRARANQWRLNNPEKVREKGYMSKYGITLADFDNLRISQRFCCKICSAHETQFDSHLHVDHCHKTGKVRGLLCGPCNKALGLFKDNITSIHNAAEYLEQANSKLVDNSNVVSINSLKKVG